MLVKGIIGISDRVLVRERALQQPCDDWQILALVESRQDHRVGVLGRALFAGRHCENVLQLTLSSMEKIESVEK